MADLCIGPGIRWMWSQSVGVERRSMFATRNNCGTAVGGVWFVLRGL